ncbi:hypothetical protein JCM11251_005674 [Rhodosporidiobolus azoricus]
MGLFGEELVWVFPSDGYSPHRVAASTLLASSPFPDLVAENGERAEIEAVYRRKVKVYDVRATRRSPLVTSSDHPIAVQGGYVRGATTTALDHYQAPDSAALCAALCAITGYPNTLPTWDNRGNATFSTNEEALHYALIAYFRDPLWQAGIRRTTWLQAMFGTTCMIKKSKYVWMCRGKAEGEDKNLKPHKSFSWAPPPENYDWDDRGEWAHEYFDSEIAAFSAARDFNTYQRPELFPTPVQLDLDHLVQKMVSEQNACLNLTATGDDSIKGSNRIAISGAFPSLYMKMRDQRFGFVISEHTNRRYVLGPVVPYGDISQKGRLRFDEHAFTSTHPSILQQILSFARNSPIEVAPRPLSFSTITPAELVQKPSSETASLSFFRPQYVDLDAVALRPEGALSAWGMGYTLADGHKSGRGLCCNHETPILAKLDEEAAAMGGVRVWQGGINYGIHERFRYGDVTDPPDEAFVTRENLYSLGDGVWELKYGRQTLKIHDVDVKAGKADVCDLACQILRHLAREEDEALGQGEGGQHGVDDEDDDEAMQVGQDARRGKNLWARAWRKSGIVWNGRPGVKNDPKRVPLSYVVAPVTSRRELIAGFADGDGSGRGTSLRLIQSIPVHHLVVENLLFLVQSAGHNVSISKREHGTYYVTNDVTKNTTVGEVSASLEIRVSYDAHLIHPVLPRKQAVYSEGAAPFTAAPISVLLHEGEEHFVDEQEVVEIVIKGGKKILTKQFLVVGGCADFFASKPSPAAIAQYETEHAECDIEDWTSPRMIKRRAYERSRAQLSDEDDYDALDALRETEAGDEDPFPLFSGLDAIPRANAPAVSFSATSGTSISTSSASSSTATTRPRLSGDTDSSSDNNSPEPVKRPRFSNTSTTTTTSTSSTSSSSKLAAFRCRTKVKTSSHLGGGLPGEQ